MRKKAKFLTLIFVLFVIIPSLTLVFMMWFVDPFRLWHESFYCKDGIYQKENMRYNAKYFIDNMEFDGIIFGSSMLENTSANEVASKLGGKFINISIRGSHFDDRKIIMNYIFKHKNVKKVISSLDISLFGVLHLFNVDKKGWDFLYDDESSNDIRIYFNNKFLSHIAKTFSKIITNSKIECVKADFSRPAAWGDETKIFLGGKVNFMKSQVNSQKIQNAVSILKNEKINSKIINPNEIKKIKNKIDKDILSVIKSQPNTEFIFFIPPYSTLENAINAQLTPHVIAIQKELIFYILEQNLPNLKIYAFGDMNFTDEIANYVDSEHYGEHINSLILDFISKNIGLLTTENFDIYWQKHKQKAKSFDLFKFADTK